MTTQTFGISGTQTTLTQLTATFSWSGQASLLQGFGQQLGGFGQQFQGFGQQGYGLQGFGTQGCMHPMLQHAQQMCRQRMFQAIGQQIGQLVGALIGLSVLKQLMGGGDQFGMNPGAPPAAIEGKEKGGWLVAHGQYTKKEDGSFTINAGAYAGHTAVSMGQGKFNIVSQSGSVVGTYNAPGGQDKIASPLTYDLNGDGKVSTTGANKRFDINGDGKVDQTAWAGKGDGVLTFDANKDGVSGADGRELLGNNTDVDGDGKADGHANGFEALKALALKHLGPEAIRDGKLDAREIKLLEDRAGLRMNVDGVSKKPSELGITELSLGYQEAGKNADANGNEHRQLGSFTINGQQRQANDVWFKYQ